MDAKTDHDEAFLGVPEWVSDITDEEAEKRIDLVIIPKGGKWIDTLKKFQFLLTDTNMTIGKILSAHFTTHEARLFTLSQLAVLRDIQEDNSRRFHKLLQDQFQGVTPDIPTKLTMLYFGLPIEPVDFSLTKMTYEMESRKPEPPQPAVDPPLHFLTAHQERNWGNEALLGKQNPSYPVPVQLPQNWLSSLSNGVLREQLVPNDEDLQIEQPTVRLRGGGADDDSDWGKENSDNWSEENDDDFSYHESEGEDGDESGIAEDDTAQNQPHKLDTEIEDVTMRVVDDDGDSTSDEEITPLPQSGKWTNLYGFQGCVPFIAGDRHAYAEAIRRLLSLGPRDRKAFSIVHFNEKFNTVDTINDSLPLEPDSATLHYISEKTSAGEKKFTDSRHSFFVKLKHEPAPEQWQPSEEQFSTSVSSVRWSTEGEGTQETDAPISCCYLAFHSSNGSKPSQEDMCGWGADYYSAYIKTAFEVLLGRPRGPFHHAFFRLGRSDSDFAIAPPVYGLPTAISSDILSLFPTGDGKPSYLRCNQLGDNEVAFVLPGYSSTRHEAPDLTDNNATTQVMEFIRHMMSSVFGDSARRLNYVHLLDGRATLGSEINRNQEYWSFRMSDNVPQKSEIGYASALSKIAAAGNPFVILHPVWDEDHNVLFMSTSDGKDGAEFSVHMPSLSSTVDDFKASVVELMQLAECEPSRIEDVKDGDAFISIQPMMDNEPANARIDMPCFFVGPNTTDDEWFSIRARITTPASRIKILDSKTWNWRNPFDSTNIWGPRYGLVADLQTTIQKPEKTEAITQDKEGIARHTAQETVTETVQEPIQETIQEPVQKGVQESVATSPVGVEALRALLREKEPARATHADFVKTLRRRRRISSRSDMRRKAWAQQPSIFDNYGLRTWPANSGIQLPRNAPPMEHMLRTGPRMPMVSKAILTPTEQAELQRMAWDLRSICLNRTTAFRECMMCNEPIPRHWTPEKIRRHMREKHTDELMEALGVSKAAIRRFDGEGTISIPLKKVKRSHKPSPMALTPDELVVGEPESQQHQHKTAAGFCDRCGRNGNYLNNSERAYHDEHCKPSVLNGAKCNFCTACGEAVWQSTMEARKSRKSNGQLTHCSHKVDDTDGPHCSSCGFDTSGLPQDGRKQHQKECKGFSAVSGRFCLYCGGEFGHNATQADWDRNRAHMVACYEKNQGAKSLLQPPDIAAYRQQENNHLIQINDAIDASEREQEPENEAILGAASSGREQNMKEIDLDGSGEESRRPKPTKRFNLGRLSQEVTDNLADDFSAALRAVMERAGTELETPQIENPDRNARHYNQAALRAVLLENVNSSPFDEATVASPRVAESRPLSREGSQDPLAEEIGKEHEVGQPENQEMTDIPELEVSEDSVSGPDNGSDFSEDNEHGEEDDSEDELQGDPLSSKRRKRGGKTRGRKGDRNYRFSDDEDDDEHSGTDEDGKRVKPPRRAPSPNWNRVLGPEDPSFEPTDEYYCSKCFRKAPKKHNRDKSPLGRSKEIELHYDSTRCCGIRRGIGSTKRLPNRSGWIPSADMPKPLGNLRKQFLRRYPSYARTVYPLNASNANGSYYRSDPNNDDNRSWWDIPWPPFRGSSPLPSGWVAPDVIDGPVAGRARKQFQLKSVDDPTYRQEKGVQDSDDDDIESDKDTNGKRKRKSRPASALSSRNTTPTPIKIPQKGVKKAEKAATPGPTKKKAPMLQRALKTKAGTPRKVAQKNAEQKAPTRRSTRKRQKTQ
ncbi:hypothetical protein V8C42DRAFT_358039 [Trichoderma barbatum]